MFTKRKSDFDRTAQRVFKTRDGLLLLKYLKEDFINRSVKGATTEDTYYNIGQQDFVKRLLRSIKTDEALDGVNTLSNDYTQEEGNDDE